MRASAVVSCHSALVVAFRRCAQAAAWRLSVCWSPMRSGRSRLKALSAISAMVSHEPCLGVWWISSRSLRRLASSGGNASSRLAGEWVLRVHDEHDRLGVAVAPVEQVADGAGPVASAASIRDPHRAPARERLEGQKEDGHAVAAILASMALGLPGTGRPGHADRANPLRAPLVQADHRPLGIGGTAVNPPHVLHVPDELRRQLGRDAPHAPPTACMNTLKGVPLRALWLCAGWSGRCG